MKSYFALVALLAASVNAFSMNANNNDNSKVAGTMSRSAFIAGAILAPASAAFARDIKDANFEGTASAANAKTCMDRCLYEKIKGGMSKKELHKSVRRNARMAKAS